ncbi:hypothetical protein E2C01_052658 [Portunus trituberculatus]|uniref:Uncharacterized protein n=1 Tax=Portunus trituberculatus TaxID=210409 RepID=A0A5B7GF85_PORTR|nr:hypothetical protein [Portunus trituberculatus]
MYTLNRVKIDKDVVKGAKSLDARENAIGRDKVLEGSELGRRSRFRLETLPYSFKVGGSPYRSASFV